MYSLTPHDRYGTRVPGLRQRTCGEATEDVQVRGLRLPYDHRHQTASDKGVPYAFESASRLLEDFFAEVDRVTKEARQ